jgi:hypothetical protein
MTIARVFRAGVRGMVVAGFGSADTDTLSELVTWPGAR